MLEFIVSSKDKKEAYSDVRRIFLPGVNGRLEILPGHAESFFLLQSGEVTMEAGSGAKNSITLVRGLCWAKDDRIVLMK